MSQRTAIADAPNLGEVKDQMELSPAERELLLEELAALAGSIRDPAARSRYAELGGAVADGQIGGDRMAPGTPAAIQARGRKAGAALHAARGRPGVG